MPAPKSNILWSALPLTLIVAVAFVAAYHLTRDPLDSQPRRAWRDNAITHINQRLADNTWIASESNRLQSAATTRPRANWVGEEMLVMKNGDWIVCQNVCRKQPAHIPDIFIGRGSDGIWYYSTFHFCVHMYTLTVEDQPASLAQFAQAYWLKPFDGHSDDSLRTTWDPGQPYGEALLQSTNPNP